MNFRYIMDIVFMDNEDVVEDFDDVKKDLLERVRHLSDYQINNDNTRLSFGIQENVTKMQDLSVGGVKKFDKGFSGVQDVTDRLKRSPLKQMNKTIDTHENREQQPFSEGKSLGSLASRHLSDSKNSGGKGFTLGSLGSSSPGCLSLPSGTLSGILPTNKLTGNEGTGISLNSLANSHLGGNSGLSGSQTSGLTLNSLTSKPSSGIGGLSDLASKSEAVRPSLGALASNHLSGSQASRPSLGALASNHLCESQASRPTLGALASNHLSSSSAPSESKAPGLSLSSLATSHLAAGSSGLATTSLVSFPKASTDSSSSNTSQQFTIPAIFGPKTCPHTIPKERSASPEVEIDLMSALKLGAAGQDILEETKTAEVQVVKAELIVPDISRISSELRKRKRSAFSKVITRKWARSDPPTKVTIRLPTNNIPVFQFGEPSPDEIVLKAQSQSKAFNRPSPVRQVRQTIKT